MAILGGVVVADDEVCYVWGEVIFVFSSEVGNLLCYDGLKELKKVVLVRWWCTGVFGGATNSMFWGDTRAADDDALERLCWVDGGRLIV